MIANQLITWKTLKILGCK